MKISIIVAVYNCAITLQQCIDSVAQQTYPNKELIIIDGGSNDGTVKLLEANREIINYLVSEPDAGIYNAWNKGVVQAKGEWICFLGADDFFWDKQALELMAAALVKLPSNIRVAYGQIMLLNNDGQSLYQVGEPWEKVKVNFKQVMSIPHPGLMHRRSLFEERGMFDESFRIAGDYELLLRELKFGDAAFMPDVILTGMRQGGISSEPDNILASLCEVRRAQKMHGQHLPGMLWLMAIVKVHIRRLLWCVVGEAAAKKMLDLGRRAQGLPKYWTKT